MWAELVDMQPPGLRRWIARLACFCLAAKMDRDRYPKSRAFPGLALHADAASKQLGDPLAQRQPESGAAPFALQGRIDLHKVVEHGQLMLFGNADAGIGYGERNP